MLDGIIRIIDKLAVNNIETSLRKEVMGPYQTIGEREACEISSLVCEFALDQLKNDDELSILNLDAMNAYNSFFRQSMYEYIVEKIPDLHNYYLFLYDDEIQVDFDHNHTLFMSSGGIQGLCSSELFYSMIKWKIQQNAENRMVQRHPDFRIHIQTDYVDDGLSVQHYKYLGDYIQIIESEYNKVNIKINKVKTCIVMVTNNIIKQNYINDNFSEYKINFQGNIKYLGSYHGTDEYIINEVDKIYVRLQKKLLHIELINDRQIKLRLFIKFLSYNKIIFLLKTTRIINEWLDKINNIYEYIRKSIIMHLNYKQTIHYQLSLRQRSGGFGLRSPKIYYIASKITSLSNKIDRMKKHFRFELYDELNMNDLDPQTLAYNKVFFNSQDKLNQYIDELYGKFNEFIGPDLFLERMQSIKHSELLDLMDKKWLSLFYQNATEQDMARMKCISNNGASQWLNVVPNKYYGVVYTNREMYILLSLYLGCKINTNETICQKRKEVVDIYGYHALLCKYGKQLINRHNLLRDVINKYLIKAGFETKKQQKYKYDDDDKCERIKGVPGDVFVKNWDTENGENIYGCNV